MPIPEEQAQKIIDQKLTTPFGINNQKEIMKKVKDDCPIPELLKDFRVIDWEDGVGKDKLLEAIQVGLERRRA